MSVDPTLVEGLRHLVVSRFGEMGAEELAATMMLAASVEELVKVVVPACKHD